jgi:hypothetical protein
MCEKIYDMVNNQSIWLCQPNMIFTQATTLNNTFLQHKTLYDLGSLPNNSTIMAFNTTVPNNSTIMAFNTTVPNNSTIVAFNTTMPNNSSIVAFNTTATNSINTTETTNTTISNEKTQPPKEKPEETPPSEPTNTQRVIVYLRHSNRSNSSNTTNKLNNCVCDTSQPWLHMFWIFPVFIVLAICFLKWRSPKHRISNVFVPQQTKKLTRSQSWPKISEVRPVNRVPAFPASEPGDVSSRGVFLTGIL